MEEIKQSPESSELVHLDIMAMRECGQNAVREELKQTHSWKLIRIVCEAIYKKFGTQQSKLVPLNKIFIEELRSYWSFNKYQEPNHNYHDREDFIKYELPKYGSPSVPSVEAIEIILKDVKSSDNQEHGNWGTKEQAQAIHRLFCPAEKTLHKWR